MGQRGTESGEAGFSKNPDTESSSNILMAGQSGQSVVEVGAGSCSSATLSTTLPISLYSESAGLA